MSQLRKDMWMGFFGFYLRNIVLKALKGKDDVRKKEISEQKVVGLPSKLFLETLSTLLDRSTDSSFKAR